MVDEKLYRTGTEDIDILLSHSYSVVSFVSQQAKRVTQTGPVRGCLCKSSGNISRLQWACSYIWRRYSAPANLNRPTAPEIKRSLAFRYPVRRISRERLVSTKETHPLWPSANKH